MKVGIYNRWLPTLGGGERYSLSIAEYLSRSHDVYFIGHEAVEPEKITGRFGLDISRIIFVTTPARPVQQLAPLTAEYDLFINASNWDFFPSLAEHSAMVVYFPLAPANGPVDNLRYQIGRGLNAPFLKPAHSLLPALGLSELRTRLDNLIPPNFLDHVRTYDHLWSISAFVQRWTNNYWDMPSDLLYPPVSIERFSPAEKQQRLLSVGRFFAGNHNKKHLMMVQAFRELIEDGLTGWELHLVGGVNAGELHQQYFQQVRQAAEGLPIVFHTDIDFDQLQDLYAGSALYWHASGYGENEEVSPRKFEHFGITTVEAMAAGCVPIVIGNGGQPELVTHGESGFLWHTDHELNQLTLKLIADAQLRQQIGKQAVTASRQFDQQHFEERLAVLSQRFGL